MPLNDDLPDERDAIIARMHELESERETLTEQMAANRQRRVELFEQRRELVAECTRLMELFGPRNVG